MKNTYFLLVNYGCFKECLEFIKHIENLLGDNSLEFVIVNNFSSQIELDLILGTQLERNINVIFSDVNLGYARGNNLGLKYIFEKDKEAVVFVSNSDIEFENKNLIHTLRDRAIEGNSFVSARMEIENVLQTSDFRFPTLLDDILYFVPNRIKSYFPIFKIFKPERESDLWTVSDWVNGSFFCGTINVFNQVGYFDEGTFLYCEERILGYRAKENGILCEIYERDTYSHTEGGVTKKFNSKFRLASRLCDSRVYYYKKYKTGFEKFLGSTFHNILSRIFKMVSF